MDCGAGRRSPRCTGGIVKTPCPTCLGDGHLIDSVRTRTDTLSHLFECAVGHLFSRCGHPRSLRTLIADVQVAGVGVTMRQERCTRCGAHVEFLRDGRVLERHGELVEDVTQYFPKAGPVALDEAVLEGVDGGPRHGLADSLVMVPMIANRLPETSDYSRECVG